MIPLLHQSFKMRQLRNVFLIVTVLVAMASTVFLPSGVTAFALTDFDNEHRSAIVDVQPQESKLAMKSLSPSRGNDGIIRIFDIHTLPSIVHKGDTFKVVATIQNNMQQLITYTTDCSPLSPTVVFDKDISTVNQKICNISPSLQHVYPGQNVTIEIPGNFGGDFMSTGKTGLAHGTVIFNYEVQNSIQQHSVSKRFSFVIQAKQQQQPTSLPSGNSMDKNAIIANLDEIFKVKLNQTALIRSENLTIKVVNVDDFRCPIDVVCIWEGDGIVSLNLTKDGVNLDTVTLGINNRLANNSQSISGAGQQQHQQYILHLLALEPYPATSKPVGKSDYVATLIVTKANTTSRISTISLKAGERDGPLQVIKIFPNQIQGLAFREFPVAVGNGTAITMKIGDSVSNGCNTSLIMLSIHDRDFAIFLKVEEHHKICPL